MKTPKPPKGYYIVSSPNAYNKSRKLITDKYFGRGGYWHDCYDEGPFSVSNFYARNIEPKAVKAKMQGLYWGPSLKELCHPNPIMDDQQAIWADAQAKARKLAARWMKMRMKPCSRCDVCLSNCANELERAFGISGPTVSRRNIHAIIVEQKDRLVLAFRGTYSLANFFTGV